MLCYLNPFNIYLKCADKNIKLKFKNLNIKL